MNLQQLGIGGVLGVIVTGLPMWTFFESRTEKRVRHETRLEGLAGDHKALKDRMTLLEGRTWTAEREILHLGKQVAVQHARDQH